MVLSSPANFICRYKNGAWSSVTSDPWGSGGIGSNIVAGTLDGIVFSSDNGNTWVSANSGINQNLNITALTNNGNTVFAGTKGGFWYATE